MKRQDIHIAEPCHAEWGEMRGDETSGEMRRRFCDSCSKHVHDLSSMRREDAQAFLAEHREGHVCVQYLVREDDEVIFQDDGSQDWKLYWQRDGLKRLMAAAALALPLSLATACDSPTSPVQPTVEAPIVIEDGKAPKLNPTSPAQPHTSTEPVTQPGAGRAPTFKPSTPAPEVKMLMGEERAEPPEQPEIHEVKGDIAEPPRTTEAPPTPKKEEGSDCAEKPEHGPSRMVMGQAVAQPKDERQEDRPKASAKPKARAKPRAETVPQPHPERAKTSTKPKQPAEPEKVKHYMGFEG